MDTPSDGIPLGDVAPNLLETAHLTLAFLNQCNSTIIGLLSLEDFPLLPNMSTDPKTTHRVLLRIRRQLLVTITSPELGHPPVRKAQRIALCYSH